MKKKKQRYFLNNLIIIQSNWRSENFNQSNVNISCNETLVFNDVTNNEMIYWIILTCKQLNQSE